MKIQKLLIDADKNLTVWLHDEVVIFQIFYVL